VDLGGIVGLLFLLLLVIPVISHRVLDMRRGRALAALERVRGARVIAMIHRQETVGVFGVPFYRFIDIEDSEAVLRAIRETDDERPIDLLLHTPGGLVLAAEQIARALQRHPGKVTVLVPHYAMSGGTLLALAADEILMDPAAVLGPVDPQLGEYPAASILTAVGQKDPNETDDKTLILADVARKAQVQVRQFVNELLRRQLADQRAAEVAAALSEGRWTHDFPIDADLARSFDLKVSTDLPDEVRLLMRLYPQPRNRRPSVEYIPVPYQAPEHKRNRRTPATRPANRN
jgi:ClpP class serine protease